MNYNKEHLEKAKSKINLLEYIENYCNTKAKNVGNTYYINPCPKCGHKDHFSIDIENSYYKSFADCCRGGSIIDFLLEFENLNLEEAITKTLSLANMNSITDGKKNEYSSKAIVNFNNIIEETHRNVGNTDYFLNRGLSDKTIDKYKLGYSKIGFNFAIGKNKDIKETESDIYKYYRYYLPILDENNICTYFLTRIEEKILPENLELNKNHNLLNHKVQLFNQRYITHSEVFKTEYIFVVEGIFDALSVEEFDYKAVALNSSSNAKKFISMVETNKNNLKHVTFILIPDNDKAGENTNKVLRDGFKKIQLPLQICDLPNDVKDVNELLQNNREELKNILECEISKKKNEDFCISYMAEFTKLLNESKKIGPIKTGLDEIDKILDGGFYPGLYTIGAIPSLGKTTLMHQIADYVSSLGHDVLYFSLEMGKFEMMRKSLAREILLLDRSKNVTTRQISMGEYDTGILNNAMQNYINKIASNMAILEGNFNTTVLNIRKKVEKNIKIRGKNPIVIIDYLQILKAQNEKMSDKQANDYNITELKKISRDYNITVIAISSFNRTNYNSSIGFESFKETGAIEYGSDVILGLQLMNMDKIEKCKTETEKRNIINELKKANPRELELILLKNREGQSFDKCKLKYYAPLSYFQ